MSDLDERPPDAPARSAARLSGRARRGGVGPLDSEDPAAARLERRPGRVDFGSLRMAIPARAQLQVEKGSKDLLRAIHVLVPSGRVSLSALAAPRSNPLWRGLAGEIAESLGKDGADVRVEWGEWGREVRAGSNGALSRFVGVDGPRWMLYGVATGPEQDAAELAEVLREMVRGTVVMRGPDPLPVKTVLPLRLPEQLEHDVERAREESARRPKKKRAGTAPPAARAAQNAPPDRGVAPAARQPMAPRRGGGTPVRSPALGSPVAPAAGFPAVAGPVPPVPPISRPPASAPGRQVGPPRTAPGDLPATAQLPPPPAAHRPGGAPTRPTPAIGPLGAPAARVGLPPVPGYAPSATNGLPAVSAVEATWSSTRPVVSADQLAQQPAWALLGDAPSFWPDERPTPGGADMSPPAAVRYEALPADPPRPADVTGPDDGWPHTDLLSQTDALHRVLTHDAAATQDWRARAERRGRHRPPGD